MAAPGSLPQLARTLAAAFATQAGQRSRQLLQEVPALSQTLAQLERLLDPPPAPLPPHAAPAPPTPAAGTAAANRAALDTLRAFLQRLTEARQGGHPPAMHHHVAFTLRQAGKASKPRRSAVLLRTTGGECRGLVEAALGQLFAQAGLPPAFRWDAGQWGLPPPGAPDEARLAETRARAAAAGWPSQQLSAAELAQLEQRTAPAAGQAHSERQTGPAGEAEAGASTSAEAAPSAAGPAPAVAPPAMDRRQLTALQADISRLDGLLGAVAAVPWMVARQGSEEGDELRQRIALVRTRVLDQLEAQGWDMRHGVRRVWAGERQAEVLLAGKDAGSQAALSALLHHVHRLDQQFGHVTFSDK